MEPLVSEKHVDHGADDDDDENDQHSETLVSEDYKKKNPTKYFLNMCFGRRQRFGFNILFFPPERRVYLWDSGSHGEFERSSDSA